MKETFYIAGYCRISVDEELDRDNTSIENQKDIIQDYVQRKFPGSKLDFFVDRDRSGYTFEQREGYQEMRPQLINHKYNILIVKDFSRFARRNSRGLVELEDLRDAGVRIISIGDTIDYPTHDDWMGIQFRFLVNEMPVTDASKKVKGVIDRRQNEGKWICAVPYGYVITNSKNMTFTVDESSAEVVRTVFQLYNQGWGYKRISNYLTDLHIPTPRTAEKERKEADGMITKLKARPEWSIVTVQGFLTNDFYIGTLRQRKYARSKINGNDKKLGESEHLVFENHHEAIVDYRTFALTQEQMKKRSTVNYRGIKKYDNVYSGFLFCGDCGSPMFSMSRSNLAPAYTCGSYHRRGTNACSSHHTRVDVLDHLLKSYISRVKENSAQMIEQLELSIKNETEEIKSNEQSVEHMEGQLNDAREELKATMRQKVREIMRKPESEKIIEETFDEMIAELQNRIEGLENQIRLMADKRNTIIKVNRIAKTAIEIFDEILSKENLGKAALDLIIDRITVYTDHIDISLKPDVDALLRLGTIEEEAVNFNSGIVDIEQTQIVQSSAKRKDKVYDVNVIRGGDPLEIYTEKDGEVIFKKYSPMGELTEFAGRICESLHKTTGALAAVADRDGIIAVAGGARRELLDKRVSQELEQIMEARRVVRFEKGTALFMVEGDDKHAIGVAAPIISEGDVLGCVLFAGPPNALPSGDIEYKLAQTVAGFLGHQMET